MFGRGARGVVAASLALLGCGATRPLDSTGTGGSPAGASGSAGTAGSSSSSSGLPPSTPVVPTPKPASCLCAPGAGVDLLMCNGDWLPNTLRDAPEAVITPDGATIVFNRCNADTAGSCRSGVFRWKSGEGLTALAPDAWAFAVSSDGTKVLAARGDDSGSFIVAADGTTTDLPSGRSYAHLLSADGGTVVARVELSPSSTMAALWTVATGAQTTLGDLAGGPEYSEPTAINADASVVVGYGNTDKGQEPFLWTRAGGLVGLGTLPSQIVQTVALATSADGGVVVGSNLSDGGTAIFRWTAGGMTALGYIFGNLPLGGPESFFTPWTPPLLVSGDGAVVAGTAVEPSNPMLPQAFRWTAAAGLQKLSTARASIVRATSADGRLIAGSALASGAPPGMPFGALPYQPFVFVDGQGTRALADVLAGVDLDGMTFGDPIAVSADGRFLVGHATCAGAPAIFRAALPY